MTPFPPPAPHSTLVLVLLVALLFFVVIALAGMGFARKGQTRSVDVIPWSILLLAVIVFATSSFSSEVRFGPFFLVYTAFTSVIAGIGLVRSIRSLQRREGVSIGWFTATATLLLGFATLLSLPRVASAEEAARRTLCRNNLNHIGLAMHSWHDDSGRFPDSSTSNTGEQSVSWRVNLLDYTEFGALANQYDAKQAWDSAANLPAAQQHPAPFSCPSNQYPADDSGRYFTAYAMLTGPESVFPNGHGIRRSEIPSSSSTLMIAEACGSQIVWTEPRDIVATQSIAGINLPGDQPGSSEGWLSSYHQGGTHVGLADGSVRFVSEGIDAKLLQSLMTVQDGDNPMDELW